MAANLKPKIVKEKNRVDGDKVVVYMSVPADLAKLLSEEAEKEMRPMSVQATFILKQYYDAAAKRR